MKKAKKTPKVVLVVLITLLVVAGLFIFRSYILGGLGIGANVAGETNLAVKYANTNGLLKDVLVGVSGSTDAATNQKYIGLTGASATSTATGTSSTATTTATATSSATTTATPSNGCVNPANVKATINGSPFHLGLAKNVSTINEINFGTKDQVLDSLTYSSHGLWLSRQNTFLRVKSIPGNNDPLDVTIKFTGATLNNQSIKLVNKDPLEVGDTYSVDTTANTATLHFTANNDDSDIDGVAIYFYCSGVSPSTVNSLRQGTVSGSFDLGSTKTVTRVRLNTLPGTINSTCLKTDINAQTSTDGQTWANDKTSGSNTELVFDQPVQARYVKYIFTLRSCNQTETPKILSAVVAGPVAGATATGSSSTTVTGTATSSATATPGIFTWEGCVDGTGDLTIEGSEVTSATGNYDGIGANRNDCTAEYRGKTKGIYSGNLTGCLKVSLNELAASGTDPLRVGISNRISLGTSATQQSRHEKDSPTATTESNLGPAFKVHIADNSGGAYNYKFQLTCTEFAAATATATSTTSTTATTSAVTEPPVPCDVERPITCVEPSPVATTTTTVDANGQTCTSQICIAGTTPTPTSTTASGLFDTPSGSAAGFLVNGIKSGLSFYLIIAGVLIVGGVIVFRILKAE
jgi:hypothetical protein